jgi:hypothetical protein
MMDFEVNVNMFVKVKLTDYGISILKEKHDNLNDAIKKNGGKGYGDFEVKLDEDGYYRTQMWELMRDFGDTMSFSNRNPFDLNIIVTNGEPIEHIT